MACGGARAGGEDRHRPGRPVGEHAAQRAAHQRARGVRRSSRRLPRSSWSSVAAATEPAPVSRLMRAWIARWASPVRRDDGGDERAALVAQALAALVGRSAAARDGRRRGGRGEGGQRGRRGAAGAGVGEQLQRLAGLRSSAGPRRRGARSTTAPGTPRPPRRARAARPPPRPPPRARARGCAPPRPGRRAPSAAGRRRGRGGSSGRAASGVRRTKRPTTWRKNSSVRAVVA